MPNPLTTSLMKPHQVFARDLRAALVFFVLVVAPGVAGCLHSGQIDASSQLDTGVGGTTFRTTVIDPARIGFELGPTIGLDGTIYVCGLRGVGHGTNLWVSWDNGTSFQYVGRDPNAGLPMQDQLPSAPVIRSGTGDVGGGDCDMTVDTGGRVYLADLWAGSISISSSTDGGRSWRGVPASILTGFTDRPWIVGGDKDEVFVSGSTFNAISDAGFSIPIGGMYVARSTDGGFTFPQTVLAVPNTDRIGVNGNIAWNGERLYLPYTKKTGEGKLALMVAVSADRGATWEQRVIAEQSFFPGQCVAPTNLFPVAATDTAGGVYVSWVLTNPDTERSDLFMVASPDEGDTWNAPIMLTDRAGSRAFPWIAVKAPGSVGVTWYETSVGVLRQSRGPASCGETTPEDAEWFLHYASSTDALTAVPTFAETIVQPQPIHLGELDRPYGEVLQMRFAPDGRAVIAYIADVNEGRARPMLAVQIPN